MVKKGLLAGGLLLATLWVGMVVSYRLSTPQATVVNDLPRTIWMLSCQDSGVVIEPGETATLRPVHPCLVFAGKTGRISGAFHSLKMAGRAVRPR